MPERIEYAHKEFPADRLSRRMRLLKFSKDAEGFDESFFLEFAKECEEKWDKADAEGRRKLSMDWYLDVVAPPYDASETTHEALSAIAPLTKNMYEFVSPELSFYTNSHFTKQKQYLGPDELGMVSLYGPSMIVDVAPGECAFLKMGEYDVIGTSELSQCQALIAQKGDKIALAHVMMGQEHLIPEIVASWRKIFGEGARFRYIYPECIDAPDASDFNKESSKSQNERYLGYAQENGLEATPYYRMDAFYNPKNIGSTTVVVSRAGVNVIGTRLVYGNPSWKPNKQVVARQQKRWMKHVQEVKSFE